MSFNAVDSIHDICSSKYPWKLFGTSVLTKFTFFINSEGLINANVKSMLISRFTSKFWFVAADDDFSGELNFTNSDDDGGDFQSRNHHSSGNVLRVTKWHHFVYIMEFGDDDDATQKSIDWLKRSGEEKPFNLDLRELYLHYLSLRSGV
ncbi:OLC1v1030361C2 [Oldenlandia corymbosa var. corymbosa]|uniref:OLC1v1030361C2 n=1 Tax=Oldenlandia corymbosa var. corymbosa TaxID=529605 RepID=A0AAV1CGP0_OLDCO|nr:OLC1v1030361C2 [Oldenlandia corymbosa var. corymbosa]